MSPVLALFGWLTEPVGQAIEWLWEQITTFTQFVFFMALDVVGWGVQLAFTLFIDFTILIVDLVVAGVDTLNEAIPFDADFSVIANILSIGNNYLPLSEAFLLLNFLIITRISIFVIRLVLKATPTIW
jgi:hypothetical protein